MDPAPNMPSLAFLIPIYAHGRPYAWSEPAYELRRDDCMYKHGEVGASVNEFTVTLVLNREWTHAKTLADDDTDRGLRMRRTAECLKALGRRLQATT